MNKIIRVRHHRSGELGWYDTKSFGIRSDSDPSMLLLGWWQRASVENQEDFGFPSEGYQTAFGWWVELTEGDAA